MTNLNPQHPVSRMVEDNLMKLMAVFIWKMRHHLKNLEVRLTGDDFQSFNRSIQDATLACIGEQDALVLRLTDATGRQLLMDDPASKLDHPRVVEMEAMLAARKRAPELAESLTRWSVSANHPPEDFLLECANVLLALSGPHEKK